HLGEAAGDRGRLFAEAVAEGFTDLFHGGRSYRPHRMEARELDYDLPEELIAQHPATQRDESRLLVFRRATGEVSHNVFRELPGLFEALAVVNDTRVVAARIPIEHPRGEVLL